MSAPLKWGLLLELVHNSELLRRGRHCFLECILAFAECISQSAYLRFLVAVQGRVSTNVFLDGNGRQVGRPSFSV
jgi:hypothetical protein